MKIFKSFDPVQLFVICTCHLPLMTEVYPTHLAVPTYLLPQPNELSCC